MHVIRTFCCVFAVFLTLGSHQSRAASPRDELLKLVPDDVGLCLLVQNLRGHLAEVVDSPFARQLGKSALVRSVLASGEWKELQKSVAQLELLFDVRWRDLIEDILGEAAVFAYRPGPPGKPEQEQGLLLLRVRKPAILAQLIDRLNALQKEAGDLRELQPREYRGVKYLCRVEKEQSSYYLLRGSVLLYTGQEPLMRAAIDRELNGANGSDWRSRFRELGLESAVLALAVNPRAYDSEILGRADQSTPAQTLAIFWRAFHGLGLSVHLSEVASVKLQVLARPEGLPPAARRFLSVAGKPSALWSSVPANALLAVGGRLDGVASLEALSDFLNKESRDTLVGELQRSLGAMLGKDLLREVLPALGPDWGLVLVPPGPASKAWLPQGRFALRLAAESGEEPLDETLLQTVQTFAQMALLAHNKKHPDRTVRLRVQVVKGTRIRSVAGEGLPAGLEPAWAVKEGYLLLASHPDEIAKFKAPASGAEGDVLLVSVSLRHVCAYLSDRHEALSSALASSENIEQAEASRRLESLRGLLELVDRAELRQSSKPGGVAFTLSLQPSAGLRKR